MIFDSTDMQAAWSRYTQAYQELMDNNELPEPLYLQPCGLDFPGVGKALSVLVTWVDEDHEKGQEWIDKIAVLGGMHCIVNMTQPSTMTQYTSDMEKMVTWGSYGRCRTISVKRWTPRTAEVLAKYTLLIPGSGIGISVHSLRSPEPNNESVFGARVDHHMIELMALTADKQLEPEAETWATALVQELGRSDAGNVLDSSYISLLDEDNTDLSKVYGPSFDVLRKIKMKYDPENVFKHAVPKVSVE